ncbi:hypothetical protein [Filimonas effusa]|uniref:Uncharacterized protein n=1 Tax=Filimonas effusa TaxID=2508721 RepID=A0A4Q1D9Y6_9BACT|nr:hypothetical protein [Filimonas effusa]RXK86192.1 hypothetical protein ESB13_05125 [Filimonas effusa]
MKQQEPGYTRRITIQLRPEEFEKLDAKRKKSTHQSRSDFARNILLSKPVTMKYRNQSADEVLSALLKIKAAIAPEENRRNPYPSHSNS